MEGTSSVDAVTVSAVSIEVGTVESVDGNESSEAVELGDPAESVPAASEFEAATVVSGDFFEEQPVTKINEQVTAKRLAAAAANDVAGRRIMAGLTFS
jgi:hypothetical protein